MSYIVTTIFSLYFYRNKLRHIEGTAYKLSGPVWDESMFLKEFHMVTWLLYICNAFAFKSLITQLIIWNEIFRLLSQVNKLISISEQMFQRFM